MALLAYGGFGMVSLKKTEHQCSQTHSPTLSSPKQEIRTVMENTAFRVWKKHALLTFPTHAASLPFNRELQTKFPKERENFKRGLPSFLTFFKIAVSLSLSLCSHKLHLSNALPSALLANTKSGVHPKHLCN